jgi:MauM/NapG family ferredoxin protein
MEEVWPAELLAKKPEVKGKTLFDVLYKNGKVNKFPVADLTKVNAKYIKDYANDESKALGFYLQKGLFEEYAEFGRGHGHDLAPFDTLPRGARPALAGGRRQGDAVALPRGLRPVREEGRGREVLRPQGRQGGDLRAALPARRRSPDKDYDLWLCTGRVLEHWHTGTMTRRVPELHRAVPEAVCSCTPTTRRRAASSAACGEGACRGAARSRSRSRPRAATRCRAGLVFVPFFDEGRLVNKLTLDATCPISKETDFKKCAVKVIRRLSAAKPTMDIRRRQLLQGSATATTAALIAGGAALVARPALARAGAGAAAAGRAGRRRLPGRLRALRPVRARLPAANLKLSAWGDGGRDVAIGTPYFVARDIPCEMCEDIPCVKACPTGALDHALTDINQARMGVAVLIDQENCLNFLGLRCDVCYRVCPVIDKAITLEKRQQPAQRPPRHAAAHRACRTLHRLRQVREELRAGSRPPSRCCRPQLARGELGHHYRKGWEEKGTQAGKPLITEQIELPVRCLEARARPPGAWRRCARCRRPLCAARAVPSCGEPAKELAWSSARSFGEARAAASKTRAAMPWPQKGWWRAHRFLLLRRLSQLDPRRCSCWGRWPACGSSRATWPPA